MITIVGIIFAFKMSSFKSKIKEFSIIYVAALLPILLLILLMFMNKWYGTPVLQLTTIQSYILAGVILLVLLIGEAYILGWIGILTVIVPLFIMFVFKGLGEKSILGNLRVVTSVRKFICINAMVFQNEERKVCTSNLEGGNMMLSQESRDFLANTGTYLTAKGISEKDIESFLEDAKLHLTEGKKGVRV